MPSSYTSSARFTLQATGENNNTWGAILNAGVFQLVDDNINGRLAFALSGAKVLTTNLGATDEARMKFLDVTGGTGGTITIPAVSKGYYVRNGATGNVVVSAGGATTATLKAGDIQPVFSDGASVYNLRIAGQSLQDFITSQITGSGQLPPASSGAVGQALIIKAGPVWGAGLVDANGLAAGAAVGNLGFTPVNKAGDSMTGGLTATALGVGANFQILTDANSSVIYFNATANPGGRLNYYYGVNQLNFEVGGIAKFSVDANGNGMFTGTLNAAGGMSGNVLVNGSVTQAKLAANSVGAAQIINANVQGGHIAANSINGSHIVAGAVGSTQIADGSVINSKIALNAIFTGNIAGGQVGNPQMAVGAAVANIGYPPLNKNGDTVNGPLTVAGLFTGQGQVKGLGGVFAGNSARVALGTDDASYGRVYLDTANGCYIHCNWNTGKISFYIGNLIVASLDSAGNLVARGTFAFTTVPTP